MTLHNRDLKQRSEIFVLVKHFKRLSPRVQNGDRFHQKSLQFMINKNNTMTNQQHITTTTWSTTPPTSKPLSILHLAVAATSAVRSNSFLDDESISLFPSAQVFLSSLNSSPTPLILKSTVKDVQVVEFLLQCGFSTSCRNNEAKTPLHTAALKVGKIVTIHHQDDDDRDGCRRGEVMHDDEMGGSGESDVMGPRPSDLVASASDGLSWQATRT